MRREILIITATIVAVVASTASFARDSIARLSRGAGQNGNDIVVGRTGSVLASGCITKVKDLHRVDDCDCGVSYEANGRCVRGPKGVKLDCVTKGWSRKHGHRETLHFANGDTIHVHDDGLIDHDD